MKIDDGTGGGYQAQVDKLNRMHSATVIRSERDAAIIDARAFIISSAVITLTSAAETPILYFKNNDSRDLYLDVFISNFGTSTGGGTNDIVLRTYANIDDSSTIVSNAVDASIGNANLASSVTFTGVAYKGATGDTIVGGTDVGTFIRKSTSEGDVIQTSAVAPKGFNTLFSIEPPTGNTSMDVTITQFVYYIDKDLPV